MLRIISLVLIIIRLANNSRTNNTFHDKTISLMLIIIISLVLMLTLICVQALGGICIFGPKNKTEGWQPIDAGHLGAILKELI